MYVMRMKWKLHPKENRIERKSSVKWYTFLYVLDPRDTKE